MRKCFISYRHVKPDEDLAQELEKCLSQQGHRVFVDTQILVVTKWAEEIEKQIRASDCGGLEPGWQNLYHCHGLEGSSLHC